MVMDKLFFKSGAFVKLPFSKISDNTRGMHKTKLDSIGSVGIEELSF